ncbi:helix-turn-helix domain-containing protein [Aerococcaceae bacterium NML191219]|nr:helix-turn-helix domain-containing protein [Aerococcaceae bacterium NML191219]
MSTFERIKQLAKRKGKNVKEVAIELGFGENLFYKWNKQSPNSDSLQAVADYFDVSVDYLLGRTDDPTIRKGDDDVQTFFRLDLTKVPEHKRADVEKAMEQYMRFLLRDMED